MCLIGERDDGKNEYNIDYDYCFSINAKTCLRFFNSVKFFLRFQPYKIFPTFIFLNMLHK